jgi:hypothetical protein
MCLPQRASYSYSFLIGGSTAAQLILISRKPFLSSTFSAHCAPVYRLGNKIQLDSPAFARAWRPDHDARLAHGQWLVTRGRGHSDPDRLTINGSLQDPIDMRKHIKRSSLAKRRVPFCFPGTLEKTGHYNLDDHGLIDIWRNIVKQRRAPHTLRIASERSAVVTYRHQTKGQKRSQAWLSNHGHPPFVRRTRLAVKSGRPFLLKP